jgi:hypothetical protein
VATTRDSWGKDARYIFARRDWHCEKDPALSDLGTQQRHGEELQAFARRAFSDDDRIRAWSNKNLFHKDAILSQIEATVLKTLR